MKLLLSLLLFLTVVGSEKAKASLKKFSDSQVLETMSGKIGDQATIYDFQNVIRGCEKKKYEIQIEGFDKKIPISTQNFFCPQVLARFGRGRGRRARGTSFGGGDSIGVACFQSSIELTRDQLAQVAIDENGNIKDKYVGFLMSFRTIESHILQMEMRRDPRLQSWVPDSEPDAKSYVEQFVDYVETKYNAPLFGRRLRHALTQTSNWIDLKKGSEDLLRQFPRAKDSYTDNRHRPFSRDLKLASNCRPVSLLYRITDLEDPCNEGGPCSLVLKRGSNFDKFVKYNREVGELEQELGRAHLHEAFYLLGTKTSSPLDDNKFSSANPTAAIVNLLISNNRHFASRHIRPIDMILSLAQFSDFPAAFSKWPVSKKSDANYLSRRVSWHYAHRFLFSSETTIQFFRKIMKMHVLGKKAYNNEVVKKAWRLPLRDRESYFLRNQYLPGAIKRYEVDKLIQEGKDTVFGSIFGRNESVILKSEWSPQRKLGFLDENWAAIYAYRLEFEKHLEQFLAELTMEEAFLVTAYTFYKNQWPTEVSFGHLFMEEHVQLPVQVCRQMREDFKGVYKESSEGMPSEFWKNPQRKTYFNLKTRYNSKDYFRYVLYFKSDIYCDKIDDIVDRGEIDGLLKKHKEFLHRVTRPILPADRFPFYKKY